MSDAPSRSEKEESGVRRRAEPFLLSKQKDGIIIMYMDTFYLSLSAFCLLTAACEIVSIRRSHKGYHAS